MATLYLSLGLINNFMGSLHSITLHRLELISFSEIPDNKCCHGNTFFLFLGPIYKYFLGFFAFHTPTRIGAAYFFWQYLAIIVIMATFFFCFLDPYINILGGSLHSIPLHGLELLGFFGNTWQQLLSWQHFFCFFYLYINIFVVSLHSKPQHRLVLTSFPTLPGNKCCHGNTFFLFLLSMYKYFCGFFACQTPAWMRAD